MKKLLASLLVAIAVSGCVKGAPANPDKVDSAKQRTMQREASAAVGLPAITNFREKRLLKTILELRDKEVTTYTYIMPKVGQPIFLCNSVGYPINDATGYTNPHYIAERALNIGYAIMPQPEPNALFTPDNSYWVMCGTKDGMTATFVAGEIIVSGQRLEALPR